MACSRSLTEVGAVSPPSSAGWWLAADECDGFDVTDVTVALAVAETGVDGVGADVLGLASAVMPVEWHEDDSGLRTPAPRPTPSCCRCGCFVRLGPSSTSSSSSDVHRLLSSSTIEDIFLLLPRRCCCSFLLSPGLCSCCGCSG